MCMKPSTPNTLLRCHTFRLASTCSGQRWQPNRLTMRATAVGNGSPSRPVATMVSVTGCLPQAAALHPTSSPLALRHGVS